MSELFSELLESVNGDDFEKNFFPEFADVRNMIDDMQQDLDESNQLISKFDQIHTDLKTELEHLNKL
jgi:hypothetical protein